MSIYLIYAKTTVTGKNVYKITWYYNDNTATSRFLAYMNDRKSYDNDSYEYDVQGLPILQQDAVRQKENIQPDELMKQWEDSGKFKIFCAMRRMKIVKPLHFMKQKEEVHGSNVRDYERITGKKYESGNLMHFITGYFEQTVSQYQTGDSDWKIKCVENLVRYGKIFKDNKKIAIPEGNEDFSREKAKEISRKKNVSTISGFRTWKTDPIKPLKDPEGYIQSTKELISKYYPDLVDSCIFSNDNGVVKITVN